MDFAGNQAAAQRRSQFGDASGAQRRRKTESAQPIRPGAISVTGPAVVDDFPEVIPVTRRELDVIETYLGALLDCTFEDGIGFAFSP